jgi:protein TonB
MIGFVDETRTEWRRWLLSGIIVLMAHGSLGAAIMYLRDDDPDDPAGAMVMDLAPFLASPQAPPTELPTGPVQFHSEAAPDKPVEKIEEKPEEKIETEEVREPEPEIVPTPEPEPDIALAALPPKPEPDPKPTDQDIPQPETTAPTTPPVAPGPVAVAPTQAPLNITYAKAEQNWMRQISTLLQRHKRYPEAARGAEGTVHLSFTLDRQGRVIKSRVVKASGFSVLDQEALAWVQRAQPFPLPPKEVPDDKLSFVVPYGFDVPR